MPPRSKNLTALRTFAAQHAAAHAKVATARPNAWCHCGSQRCGAHPAAKAHCAGAVVMILRHDPTVGRVWSVEEVCETCAPLIPNATVLARTAERSAPTTTQVPAPAPPATDDAAPARSARRAPQRPRRRSGKGR